MTGDEDAEYDGLGELIPTVDEFGVPSALLGQHSGDFFQLLGRIVALSALLEELLRQMAEGLGAIDPQVSKVHRSSDLIKRSRAATAKLPMRASTKQTLTEWIDSCDKAVERRNEYVHSLWPAQAGDLLFGWRPALNSGGHGAVTVRKDLAEMRDDLALLVRLVDTNHFHSLSAWVSIARREPGWSAL